MHWRLLSVWLIVYSNISLLVTKQIHATLDEHSLEAFNPQNCSSKGRNGEKKLTTIRVFKGFYSHIRIKRIKGFEAFFVNSALDFSLFLLYQPDRWLRPEGSALMYIISNYLQYFRLLPKTKQTNESPKSNILCSNYTRWKVWRRNILYVFMYSVKVYSGYSEWLLTLCPRWCRHHQSWQWHTLCHYSWLWYKWQWLCASSWSPAAGGHVAAAPKRAPAAGEPKTHSTLQEIPLYIRYDTWGTFCYLCFKYFETFFFKVLLGNKQAG